VLYLTISCKMDFDLVVLWGVKSRTDLKNTISVVSTSMRKLDGV
jgi:hypothetical protein